MKFRDGDSVLSMSVIRAAQVAAEEARAERGEDAAVEATAEGRGQAAVRLHDHRRRLRQAHAGSATTACSHRGGIGIKAMSLANEDRGGLVGAFIVEEGDEVLSITAERPGRPQPDRRPTSGPTGRSTMGVKFVTPKPGDAVAVVARSVEAKVDEDDVGEDVVEEATDEARRESPDEAYGCNNRRAQDAAQAPLTETEPDADAGE